MPQIRLNNKIVSESDFELKNVYKHVSDITGLHTQEFYLLQNGQLLDHTSEPHSKQRIECVIRTFGGKGGFGSMLRAIGAQIEKTTNREACRDLSGRRLRDINEEKRLKSWLEKQADREREAEERKKKKIEKLLHVPKHDFKDEKYEETRANLTEKVNDAVEQGFSKADNEPKNMEAKKRKATEFSDDTKRRKTALWVDDAISDSGDSSDCSESDRKCTKKLLHINA